MSRKAQEFASENASTLLTAGGVVGTVATAVLAGRAGYKYKEIVDAEVNDRLAAIPEEEQGETERERVKLSKTEKVVATWPHFVPPVITGVATISAVIFANRMSAQKAAALAAAYGLTQNQFEEYKTKVAEKLTGAKQDQVKEELARERAERSQGAGQIVIVEGGDVLCFDEPTGRYFKSSMEKIKQAVNQANEECIHHDHVSANFFYEEIGLPPTTWGDEVGFNTDNLVELDIKTILSPEDNRTPCLSIDFKRMPTADYMKNFR
jgi:hypothetical protein